jgi:hypothetical protein
LSNGAIAPLLSNAQPIVIVPADDDVERAAAVAATATTATAIAAAVSPKRELSLLIFTPLSGRGADTGFDLLTTFDI